MTITLTMPWPPSVNGYWRAIVRGTHATQILSEKGREYRGLALEAITVQGSPSIEGEIEVWEKFYPPTAHRRDMDNYRKAYRDALTKCGVIQDDSLIKKDHGEWCEIDRERPRVEITIKKLERKETK